MLFLDVNICVYALRPDISDMAERVRSWLDDAVASGQPIGLSEEVLASMVRITTNPRIFVRPTTPAAALDFAEGLRASPSMTRVAPGQQHWALFVRLVLELRLRANLVPDAWLAAMALEQRATFVTRDRGFRRFRQLSVLDPLKSA